MVACVSCWEVGFGNQGGWNSRGTASPWPKCFGAAGF